MTRLAAVAEQRVCPAWVTFHASRPAASINPSANRARIRAGPSPALHRGGGLQFAQSPLTLAQAFTVQKGGPSNIQITVSGFAARQAPPEVALSPSKTAFFVTAQNTSKSDAHGVLIAAALSPGFSLAAVQPAGLDSVSNMAAAGVAGWSISNLAAGQSMVFTYLGITAPAAAFSPVPIGPVWGLPGYPRGSRILYRRRQRSRCRRGHPTQRLQKYFRASKTMCRAARTMEGNCMEAAQKCGEAAAACDTDSTSSECASALTECEVAAAKCALTEKCVPTGSPNGTSNGCQQISSTFTGVGGSTCITLVSPLDPNNLVGPSGVGAQRWIKGTQPLTYGISFGNELTATAPAQAVIVTEPLGANVNLSTLSLPIVTVPNGGTAVSVPIPPGAFSPAASVNEFVTNVDLRPIQSLLVNVDAKLNPATHTLTWTFTSIDPTTGLPPLNPLVGFLPPGAGANVAFSVMPTAGLATGSQVGEQATVVFDGQSPMRTATWINSIDNTVPASRIASLPTTSTCPSFRVSWSGSDVGSGIQGFTIYSSDNGGSFSPWLSNTTSAAATFTGTVGHTYSFYGIATDLTGNVEAGKTAGEASTTVTAASSCGPPSLSAQALNVAQSEKPSCVTRLNWQSPSAKTDAKTGVIPISPVLAIAKNRLNRPNSLNLYIVGCCSKSKIATPNSFQIFGMDGWPTLLLPEGPPAADVLANAVQ